ncbi:MAG: hypothetical protein V3V08_18905 [Nannocystaceae bacterium]
MASTRGTLTVVGALGSALAIFVLGMGVGQQRAAQSAAAAIAPERSGSDAPRWSTDKEKRAGRDQLRDVQPGVKGLSALADAATLLARDYLVRETSPTGRLTYRRHLDGRKMAAKYNVLRHSGTMYALGMLSQRKLMNEESAAALARTAKYLQTEHLRDVKGHDGVKAMFSKKSEESSKSTTPEAKLGGAGLGILGLLAAREQDPESVALDDLQALARFILMMMKEDGSFHSKWSADRQFDFAFKSLFYPGEAILGLVALYHVDHDLRWIEAAVKGAGRLVISRRGQARPPPDHWLLIASAALLPVYEKVNSPLVPEKELYDHVAKIAGQMIEDQERTFRKDDPIVQGAFDRAGRCTPAATRLEGLVALYGLARERGDTVLQARIKPALIRGGEFTIRCQIESGPMRGGVVRAARAMKGDSRFNRRQREIRVDYVQHAMSALLGIARLCETGCE